MLRIFVSYRRGDAGGYAGRLYDHLAGRYGEDNVFKDVDSLEPGADFANAIARTIPACDALIAVIGPQWLGTGPDGRSRLMDPRDWVRVELATALARDLRVIPVRVGGARMPTESQLPEELRPLAGRHGIELSESSWRPQVEQLLANLERALAAQERRPAQDERPAQERRPAAHVRALENEERDVLPDAFAERLPLPAPGGWRARLIATSSHARRIRLERPGEAYDLEFKVQWYIGMAEVKLHGARLWRGAANSPTIPPMYWQPPRADAQRMVISLERGRVRGLNVLQAIRVALDGVVVYDEHS
jgi:hypothetical protein